METNRVKNSVVGSNDDEMTPVIRGFIRAWLILSSLDLDIKCAAITPDKDYAEEFALKQTSLSPNETPCMRALSYYSCQI